ncbi:sugar phosphate isomerase/epimerase [Halomonas sp. HP20-15]|uniref:sugar phosphate isomerase/epimerase n=1 Tax=Halomonas sp. HP20-15 TaxID=3085901 RepID=UPI002980B1C0|nr:sugar phosphate isomerase/epimerase [Halomonas sp. HP20-15]MDW5378498.1 sugar phosphate isomerase/epimerase [Halomonas sp. HP20-15]
MTKRTLADTHDRPAQLIATSAYGHAAVAAHGQEGILPWLAAAGATGVEIRRELLPAGFDAFAALGEACARQRLSVVYSAADELWQDDAPAATLGQRLAEAAALDARAIKFSLGNYRRGPAQAWTALRETLAAAPVALTMVENDQTPQGGTLEPLAICLHDAEQADCPLYMTFDIGNWAWTGGDAVNAAHRLGRYVRYVHCKGVVWRDGKPHAAVPSAEELHDWHALFAAFPPCVPRAIEFPLQGEDLVAVSRDELARLARL